MPDEVDFSFDGRVAAQYAQQRAHPPDVSVQIGAAIAEAMGDEAHLLEIGVGTGRIAGPTAAAGAAVTGIDLAAEMLHEVEWVDGLAITQGDMHHLPFATSVFDAVIAVHVLHLTGEVERVLAEAARVLRSGGLFIQGEDWTAPDSVVGTLRTEMRRHVVTLLPNAKPPAAGANIRELLRGLGGGKRREVIAASWELSVSPAGYIDALAARQHAESWVLPDEVLDSLVAHLREFASEKWDDPQAPQAVARRFLLRVTEGTW